MFGFSNTVSALGRSIWFRPGFSKFLTNGKGFGVSLTFQSPIEFHITLSPKRVRKNS